MPVTKGATTALGVRRWRGGHRFRRLGRSSRASVGGAASRSNLRCIVVGVFSGLEGAGVVAARGGPTTRGFAFRPTEAFGMSFPRASGTSTYSTFASARLSSRCSSRNRPGPYGHAMRTAKSAAGTTLSRSCRCSPRPSPGTTRQMKTSTGFPVGRALRAGASAGASLEDLSMANASRRSNTEQHWSDVSASTGRVWNNRSHAKEHAMEQ